MTLTSDRYLTASAPAVDAVHINGVVTATDPAARTITGRVLTYGEIGATSVGPTRFAAGSLRASDPSRVKLFVEHDPERVVGKATRLWDENNALHATFHVATGDLGDQVLASAAEGLRDGLSVGVGIVTSARDPKGVLAVSAGTLREISVVASPAFPSAVVTHVAASQPPAPVSAGYVAPLAPQTPAVYGSVTATAALTLDEVLGRMAAAGHVGGAHAALRAALTDIVPPDDAAQRDAYFRPQWLGQLWEASKIERPLIDAFGPSRALTSLTLQGFRINKPRPSMADYAGKKAPVPSEGNFGITPVTKPAQRLAGAHDVDRVFIDLGDAELLRAYFIYQTQSYQQQTEAKFAAALASEATTLPGGAPTSPVKAIVAAVTYLSKLGATPSAVAVGSDIWGALLEIEDNKKPWLFGGAASLVEGSATVGGVKLSLNHGLAAGQILAGDKLAAAYHEWKNPPLSLTAVNIANGGVDLGVFGYWGAIVQDPTALVTTTIGS